MWAEQELAIGYDKRAWQWFMALESFLGRIGDKRVDKTRDTVLTKLLEYQSKQGSKTIQCSRCRQYNVNYVLQQTRSGDEGMTVFYHCQNPKCLHKWKS